MGKLSEIANYNDAMVNGVWVNFEAGIRVRVARLYNKRHAEILSRLRAEAMEGADETKAEDVFMRSIAEGVITGWQNLEDDDGKPIPFSAEKAYEIFGNEEYRDFYDFICDTSVKRALYRQKATKKKPTS